ncbi:MAG: dephospho-CoA kinase [Pseudomonadota bacterium]
MTTLRLGLTGGIGSGKSTVARMLVVCGATLIDADGISREVTAAGGSAIAPVARQFGAQAITPDGAMDRDFIRQLVFDNPAERLRLEAIIHPLVSLESLKQTEAAVRAGSTCLLFDIPLLVESGRWRQQLDRVLVVDCSETTQVARVVARSGWTPEAVYKVMAGQATRAARRAAADLCLYNEGLALDELERMVRQISHRFGL